MAHWCSRALLSSALTLVSVLCTVHSASGQPPPSGLTGVVLDSVGLPLVGVALTLTGPAALSARTNSDGAFVFNNLAAGDYRLTARLRYFASVERTLRIAPGEQANVSIRLQPSLEEEVLVTASKSGETDIHTTPIAVSVIAADELERIDSHDLSQIAGIAPSLTFSQNSDFAQLTIRGIGTNVVFAGSDPSSAVYVNGVYFARPVMTIADFLDVERIEVLRGPQGTLYGRNAVGGAVNIITRQPSNDLAASASVSAGGHDAFQAEARVSGPLVEIG